MTCFVVIIYFVVAVVIATICGCYVNPWMIYIGVSTLIVGVISMFTLEPWLEKKERDYWDAVNGRKRR